MKDDEIIYDTYNLDTGESITYTVADIKVMCNIIVSCMMECEDEDFVNEIIGNITDCSVFYDENDNIYEKINN